jgi:cysteine desulfurase/selenocysteine lyase
MIYLDNAATSWPKPPTVVQAVADFIKRGCANPGRSAHAMARMADEAVMHTREIIAGFFNISNPLRIVFMPNTTYALNTAIQGIINPGDHVVTTMMEHNSILRPLSALEKAGIIRIDFIEPDKFGRITIQSIKKTVTKSTSIFCMTLSSNVTGAIMPVAEAGRHCRANGVLFLVDSAQGAGVIPVDVENMCIDVLAFPGHKGLLGLQGTGGLYVKENVTVKPLVQGGTGSFSDSLTQPDIFPDVLESGTLNVPGIVGLGKAVQYIIDTGISNIFLKKQQLLRMLIEGIEKESNITVYSPAPESNSGILAINIENMDSSEVGYILDKKFGICVRSGLHCAPLAHRSLGTRDRGIVRISPGYFNDESEIDLTVKALQGIARGSYR